MSSTSAEGKPTVLAVDDKPANLVALEALLGEEYELMRAGSGEEALALFSKHPEIDVILMDVQMPVMDGFETAQRIKESDTGRSVPIIFITAVFREDPEVKRGYEVGGIDYFSKPFDPEILKLKLRIYASFRSRDKFLKQRERQIRESQELLWVGRKLSTILESLQVGVLIADVDGRICQVTEDVSRILKSIEPATNDSYGEILGWWDRSGHAIKDERGPLTRALGGQATHSEAISVQCLDGSSKSILASAAPLRGLDNRLVGAVVLLQDVTEPKKLEKALEERVARLIGLGVELEESAVRI
jgi:CheY-like chemotaxis protein